LNTGVIKYFITDGTFPLFAVVASVFFIILITLGVLAYFDKKDGHREKFIKSIIILVAAAFVISSAFAISMTFHKVIERHATIGDVSIGTVVQITIDEFGRTIGFWERAVYNILDLFAESAIWIRDFIIRQNGGIRQILNKYASNPLVSYNVSYDGGTVNLYNLILISASFLLFIMVVNSGYKLAKFSYQSNNREDVIKAFQKWFYVLLLMMIIPATFITLSKIMDVGMNILNKINDSYVISTDTLTVETYGPLAPIAKIYVAYLEFKVYVLMLYRKFIINGFYLTVPIAVYLWGISDDFEALTVWTNTLLMNIFSPIFYSLAFVLGSLILRALENGENPIVMIIVSSFCLKGGDELKKIVQRKRNGSILGGSQDVNGISRTIFSVAMVTKTLHSLASKNAVNNLSSSSVNSSSNNSNSNTSSSSTSSTVNPKNTSNLQSSLSSSNSTSNKSNSSDTNILGTPKITKSSDGVKVVDYNNKQENVEPKFTGKENVFANSNGKLGLAFSSEDVMKNVKESIQAIGKKGGTITKGAQVVAGVASGIATANPVLGYAAYKGSGVVLNTTGKATTSMYNTAKNIKSGADKVGNYFKGNSDLKIHRRD